MVEVELLVIPGGSVRTAPVVNWLDCEMWRGMTGAVCTME